ncbi:hypothetical protein [Luteimonas sp. MC1750]|uniref:hypothetical protein n=1 Tax=Luteimonas sp. MC1750 TaxID=2799326 RepID=UPI0018F0A079|nr:hypothetical protein [Luteimonas sp. MC1750]MBJ6985745.1 hypothetical protein [Luteimonas sp. MC1750]MBJ6985757.1 hypothetical protein [Luteimonas sp. MC1750]QQO05912.1 hypothetical protein JGR68_00145 [Luteimonas sp. MC1750]QQO05924.1 hypothetical protein JGR68_00205 [Luteimonas sp. MC1750]
MATIHQLAEKSSVGDLTVDEVQAYASAEFLTTGQVYDALAFHLAMGYAAGALEYHFCDSAMNFVMGLTRYEVPTFAWSVYSAFDEGEFYHAGDSQEVDPAEKYTRPWIIRILREAGFDIPAA